MRGVDGGFHFKLVYPDSRAVQTCREQALTPPEMDACKRGQFIEWRQTVNPVTMPNPSLVRPVEGYRAISVPEGVDAYYWGGLENNRGGSSFLDGSAALLISRAACARPASDPLACSCECLVVLRHRDLLQVWPALASLPEAG